MHGLRIRALVGVLACLLAFEAVAQDYPTRTITLINPAAAGGSNEALKSIIFDRVAAALGMPIVMESRSGAGGAIAAAYVAKASADGYTLLTLIFPRWERSAIPTAWRTARCSDAMSP